MWGYAAAIAFGYLLRHYAPGGWNLLKAAGLRLLSRK